MSQEHAKKSSRKKSRPYSKAIATPIKNLPHAAGVAGGAEKALKPAACRPFFFFCPADDATYEVKDGGHRVPPAGLPIEQVLGEYSLSFLRRDVALFVSTRARDSF